jgi:competence ComEA-like helix-hairpin-helix protein
MNEQRVDLNAARAEELMQLPGIGPALAERIISYRETVRRFDKAAEVIAVSGIGEKTYGAIADRLAVAPAEELSGPGVRPSPGEAGAAEVAAGESGTQGETPPQVEPVLEEEVSPEEEAELEVKATPADRSIAEEGLAFEGEASEETLPKAGEAPDAAAEEAHGEEEAAAEAEAAPLPEPPPPPPPPEDVPALPRLLPWWRQVSWLWTALLGGLLGMVFALAVFAGVNGSFDVGHSGAVLEVRGRVDGLAADVDSLGDDIDGLRQRLDAMEGLTARMDRVESAVDDLREETGELEERTSALQQDVAALSENLQAVSEEVVTLQNQAEQTQGFFQALQILLNDIFGEVERESMVTPTPTPEGK